jgi:hypothetical protein
MTSRPAQPIICKIQEFILFRFQSIEKKGAEEKVFVAFGPH